MAKLTKEQKVIRALSDRIVDAQRPIQILNAIKWGAEVKEDFFQHKFKKLPKINKEYYQANPLAFEVKSKLEEFHAIERDIQKYLGQFSGLGQIMMRMCREYRLAILMLQARGTAKFSEFSQELYGSSEDAFYASGPSLRDLAETLSKTLEGMTSSFDSGLDEKKYSSEQGVKVLSERLGRYFKKSKYPVKVLVDDGIVADAAAGADVIKLRQDAVFSERDLRVLEVHEGWVHVGTTLNGLLQPVCTFLSKGPPATTIFQEGLAVIVEIFSFASHPSRIKKLTNRVQAIQLAEDGANFIEVFNFFLDEGYEQSDAYNLTHRIFRGSTANFGPFTKDLAYSKGFILIYNYIRLAIAEGKVSRIPLLFIGKVNIEDLHIYEDLLEEGIVKFPRFLPIHFSDIAGLGCWMAYSLFLNQIDLSKLYHDYKTIL